MTNDLLADSLVPIAAELIGPPVIHRFGFRETSGCWRETSSPDRLDKQDAAPRCANTKGPLTPPEPVRTSELS